MAGVTLRDLFMSLNQQSFNTRQDLEEAVLAVFNEHVTELPAGFSYQDAIDGARAAGWLHASGNGHGVTVLVPASLVAA
jgi:hypothetical protein